MLCFCCASDDTCRLPLLVYIDSYKCFELRLPVSINRLRESLSTFGLTQACLSIVWEKFCMYLRVEWAIWSRNTKRMLNINLTATYPLSLLFSTILIINWLLCFTIANVGNELIIFTFPRNWQSVSYKSHTIDSVLFFTCSHSLTHPNLKYNYEQEIEYTS